MAVVLSVALAGIEVAVGEVKGTSGGNEAAPSEE